MTWPEAVVYSIVAVGAFTCLAIFLWGIFK